MSTFRFRLDTRDYKRRSALVTGALIGRNVSTALVSSAEAIVIPQARTNLKKDAAIFEGNLFRSLSASAGFISTRSPLTFVEIGSFGVEYGKNIEEGAPKGLPFEADAKLIRWAKVKLGSKHPVDTARHIAIRLRARGVVARPFLRPAWDTTQGRFWDRTTAAIASGIRSV